MQRRDPTQRGATSNAEADDENEKPDDDKESLFNRADPDDETGQSEIDGDEADAADDEADDVKVIVVKS